MFDSERLARGRRIRLAIIVVVTFLIGLSIGARAFMNTQPRAWLNISSCADRCYRANDVAGLFTAAGIVNAPGFVPRVVRESDKCLAVPYPRGGRHLHLVFFPKRDIRDIADVTAEDEPYLMDCFAIMRAIINEQNLSDYRVYTNGPGEQDISYLHFHLVVW
jgi:Scavenger mRNA decapping enzyme C-term binding